MWLFGKTKQKTRKQGLVTRGFQAAAVDRLLANWRFEDGFTPREITSGLSMIRGRSRQMAKDSPHYRKWLNLVCTNVVGEGFSFKSMPHDGPVGKMILDESAARLIEYHFWQWGNTPAWCDAGGRKTLAAMDRMNAKVWARDGEYFMWMLPAANPYGITIRNIRPDACCHNYNADLDGNKVVRCGVEMDAGTFKPLAYYFYTTPESSDVMGPKGPLKRIPADQIIHGFTQEDEEQPRGIPLAHSTLVKLKMLDEYDRAELTAARDEACSVRTYYAPKGDEDAIADLTSDENSSTAQALVADKEPGQSEVLPIGWRQEIHTPQHPNRELTNFKDSMLKDVASGLNVEYANFANNWAAVSFSSVRAGTITERDAWCVMQDDMIFQNKTPVFRAWLKSFLTLAASGGLPASKYNKFAEHQFRGRRWMWVDPMKDVKSAEIAVAHGWKTDTQIASDFGTDYEDNLEEMKRVEPMKKAAGLIEEPSKGVI